MSGSEHPFATRSTDFLISTVRSRLKVLLERCDRHLRIALNNTNSQALSPAARGEWAQHYIERFNKRAEVEMAQKAFEAMILNYAAGQVGHQYLRGQLLEGLVRIEAALESVRPV